MSWFQLAGIAVSSAMALLSLRRLMSSAGRRLVSVMWAFLWGAACVAFVFPDGTTVVAQWLGIERGADMVMYSAVIGGFIGFWLVSMRLRDQSRQLTQLTRQVAIANARPPAKPKEADADAEMP